jgi:hypothetical protein
MLLCLQCAVTTLQGQKVFLERKCPTPICATAAFDEIEDFAFGPHRHDGIPLHVHVPDDDALRNRELPHATVVIEPVLVVPPPVPTWLVLIGEEGSPWQCTALCVRRVDPRSATISSLRAIRMLV